MPRPPNQMTVDCANCGVSITRAACFIKGRANVCCSLACSNENRRKPGVTPTPPNAFSLTPGAAEIEAHVCQLVAAGRSGPQIETEAGVTRGVLMGILKRNDLKIARNVVRYVGEANKKWQKPIEYACPTCGSAFSKKPWQVKGKKAVFCSRECQFKSMELR